MRYGSHGFWLCIAAAVAVTASAVPAASAGVHKYDAQVTIQYLDGGLDKKFVFGHVKSEVRKCERGRRVVLFKQRPGADRKLDARRRTTADGSWRVWMPADAAASNRVYAQVTRKERHRFVCRADRSPIVVPATPPDFVRYGTKLTIQKKDRGRGRSFEGDVNSAASECERGRRVTLFEVRGRWPSRLDRELGTDRSQRGAWEVTVDRGTLHAGDRVYARVAYEWHTDSSGNGFECLPDRSETLPRNAAGT